MTEPMMEIGPNARAFSLDELPAIGDAAVTMGVFDGVHLGHRAMLEATRAAAQEHRAQAVVLVFDPHPDEVVHPGRRVPRLAPLATNLRWIQQAGADHAVAIRFDAELRQLTPEAFLDGLAPAIRVRALVMSPESAFGRGRQGTVERMRELGTAGGGFEVVSVELARAGGEVISSQRIRALIAEGAVEKAAALGRRAHLEGTVVVGDRRGRQLGFPTANLAFGYVPALPKRGIYLGWTAVRSRSIDAHPCLVSVGIRPTFHPQGEVLVEAYLLDFEGDLYGQLLELDILARLRDEERFESVGELVAQMQRDEAAARVLLASLKG